MSEHESPNPIASTPPSVTPSVINRIVAASLGQRFIVILLTVVMVGAGAWALKRLPMDAYPDLSPPIVEIVTQWPGHAAEEVERLITVPIERGMNGIPQHGHDALGVAVRFVRCRR